MPLIEIAGSTLYTESAGAGDPVLVLHGGFCSLEQLRPVAEALTGCFTVHVFERPGHGRSPDLPGPYGYATETARTVAYLDALGVGAAHVVGYSDGAVLGLLLALHHPERVRSLVAVSGNLDPSAFTDPPPPAADDGAVEEQPDREREWYDRLSPDGPAHADTVLAKLHSLWTTEPHIDPADLARITAPTLVVSGDRDTIRPDHSRLIAAGIPAGELVIVPDATHDLVAEHGPLLTRLVHGFLCPRPGHREPRTLGGEDRYPIREAESHGERPA